MHSLDMFSEGAGIGVPFSTAVHSANIGLFVAVGAVLVFGTVRGIAEGLITAGHFTLVGLFARVRSQVGFEVLQT